MSDKITKHWELYEQGKKYNNAIIGPNDISYYDMIDASLSFASGNQWRGVQAEDMPKPVFNFIKRAQTFFIASLTSSNATINFEKLEHVENEENEAVEVINAEVKNILEKMKFENRLRDLLFDASTTGDGCLHFYFDPDKKSFSGKGQICHEIVDGSNVMFGNANNPNVEDQPYIIIVGRDLASNLQEEAKQYKNDITVDEDKEYEYMPGDNGKIEVETDKYGKALYILIYEKKPKNIKVKDEFGNEVEETIYTVHASKCVKGDDIFEDIDTELEYYPIAWLNWEKQKNQYHGKGMVVDMIPNQIAINKMFAMIIYHLMITAFPTAVYNADKVSAWTNEIGGQIALMNMELGDSINNVAGYLQPSQMSNQIITALDMAIRYTKECMGITDASLGAIDPKNTSAIIAVQKSAVVPLENVKANLYEFIEDIGRILLDFISSKYGTRKIIVSDKKNRVAKEYDFSQLKGQWLNTRANVGSAAYYSEIASMQTLDNLLNAERIDFVQYLERLPEYMIPDKEKLISDVKIRLGIKSVDEEQAQRQEYESMAQYEESLPQEIRGELSKLTDSQREETVKEMMAQDVNPQQQAQMNELDKNLGGA